MQGDPNRVLGLIRRAAAAFQAGRMDEADRFAGSRWPQTRTSFMRFICFP
jgi:hypothetical protein